MNGGFLRWCAVAAVGVVGVASLLGQAPALETVRVVGIPARPLPIAVAEQQGLFVRNGLAVVADALTSSDALRDALATGHAEIASAAVDNAVALAEQSGVDIVIVLGGEGTQNELIAQPEIKSVADLKGHAILVDAPNTAFALQLKKILQAAGLAAGRDYELKPLGTTPQRLQAMREHKEYGASMLGPPTSVVAKREGFVSLASARQAIGPYQGIGQFTRRDWAHSHRDTLVAYLAAYIEAHNWMMAPANKAPVLDLLMKTFRLPQEAALESYGAMFASAGGFNADARFDIAGFENVLKLRADMEGSWNGHPPDAGRYYDPSYFDAALVKVRTAR